MTTSTGQAGETVTMDPVAAAYNESCRTEGGGLARAARFVQENHPAMRNNPRRRELVRPLFVPERQLRGFFADLRLLLDLLTSLPERLFDGDLDRYVAALGIEDRWAALTGVVGGRPPQIAGRADVYQDDTGFKVLEFGITSECGGWPFAGQIPQSMLEVPEFALFAAEHRLGYVNSGQELATALRHASAAAGLGHEPVVGLVEGPGGLARWGGTWRVLQLAMQALGVDFLVGDLTEISQRGGRVFLADRPVDVVYRCFDAADVCVEPGGLAQVELLCRAHDEGRVVLWSAMNSNLFEQKGCLALLSDPRWAAAYSADERAAIDRVLPWTRALRKDSGADMDSLVAYCRDRRTDLILKPNAMYGGIGVVAGWEVDDEEWWRALQNGVSNGAVVQRRVVPRTEVMVNPETGADEYWKALWGVFYTPAGYAGARSFVIPESAPAVQGIDHGKEVLAAGVFHHDG